MRRQCAWALQWRSEVARVLSATARGERSPRCTRDTRTNHCSVSAARPSRCTPRCRVRGAGSAAKPSVAAQGRQARRVTAQPLRRAGGSGGLARPMEELSGPLEQVFRCGSRGLPAVPRGRNAGQPAVRVSAGCGAAAPPGTCGGTGRTSRRPSPSCTSSRASFTQWTGRQARTASHTQAARQASHRARCPTSSPAWPGLRAPQEPWILGLCAFQVTMLLASVQTRKHQALQAALFAIASEVLVCPWPWRALAAVSRPDEVLLECSATAQSRGPVSETCPEPPPLPCAVRSGAGVLLRAPQ